MGSFVNKKGPKNGEKGPKADGKGQKQKKWAIKTIVRGDFSIDGFDSRTQKHARICPDFAAVLQMRLFLSEIFLVLCFHHSMT